MMMTCPRRSKPFIPKIHKTTTILIKYTLELGTLYTHTSFGNVHCVTIVPLPVIYVGRFDL